MLLLVLLEEFQLLLVLTPAGAGDPKKPEEEEAPPLKRLEGVAAGEAPPKENVLGPPGVEPANSDELPYGVADGVAGFEGVEAPPKLKPDAGVDGANVFMVEEPHVTMVVQQQ